MHTRIARWVGRQPRALHHMCVQGVEPSNHGRVGANRHEDTDGPRHRCGESGRRQGRIAAGRDRERWARRPASKAELLGSPQVQQNGEQVASLVATGDVVRLVLHPDATIGAEAKRLAEAVGTFERRGHESGAGDRRDQRVELGHHRVAGGGGEAVRRNEAVPCEVAAKGEEGVGLAGGQQRRDALHQLHGVAPVGLGGVGAAPCERLRDVDGCTTHDALPTRHERPIHHHRQPAATRSLNSVIMSSHTGSRRRRPCQNDWCRRASNSSKGVPCCSTHV